ncbi:uncharacterized protein [Euphorbia lathyris]|uniref:uncharacterized protein n=1 Tax=Euphorbia lathyris TaxID=212925 RepID=UPI003313F3E5
MATPPPPTPSPPSSSAASASASGIGIQEKLMKYKFHMAISLVVTAIGVSLIYLAPRFVTILAYFWPLFVSTALFLGAVVLFGKTSIPADEISALNAGEDLLDYVVAAGQNDPLLENLKSE